MLKTAISSLSSTLTGATRSTLSDFKPTTNNIISGAINNLAQQGIANLSYRSPGLVSLAQSALHNFQLELLKKQKLQDYVKSSQSDWLRPQVQSKLGPNTSSDKVEQEMMKIISKMSSAIDRDGVEATKKSGVFKEYEKYFQEFKKQTAPQQAQQTEGTTTTGSELNSEILSKIEANTSRTVNVLEELAVRGFGSSSTNQKPSGKDSFIDPLTGMPSISAAVGSIGGSILSKVFNEATIDKVSTKIQKMIGGVPESMVTPAKKETVQDVLNKQSESLGAGLKDVIAPDNTSESAREISATESSRDNKLYDIASASLDELKSIKQILSKEQSPTKETSVDKQPQPKSTKPSIDKSLSKTRETIVGKPQERIPKGQPGAGRFTKSLQTAKAAADYAPKVASTAGKVVEGVSTMSKVAGVVEGVGAVARGGSILGAIGTGLGALAAAPMVVAAAPWVAGAAGVAAAGYGGYKLAEHYMGDKSDKVKTSRSPASTQIAALTAAKTRSDAASSKPAAPVVISGGQSSKQVTPTNINPIIVPSSVRNRESTFERVQMQDFWPRTP